MYMFYTKYQRPQTRFWQTQQPSLAVPDQTMSLKTMVHKYVKGLPFNAPSLPGEYTGEQVATDFKKLDLAEQEQLIFEAAAELSELKGRVDKEALEKAAKQEKRLQEMEKELEELRKKQIASNP